MTTDPLAQVVQGFERRRQQGLEARKTELSLYVALGDSFSAGTGCGVGEAWPDRLAAGLRAQSPSLDFRNLAVHGATSAEVLAQVPQAIELEPDLVTVVCGANDVLRSTRPDAAAFARRLASILGRLAGANPGVRVVTATVPERWEFLALGPRTRARVENGIARFNRATRTVASVYGVSCLDVANHPGLSEAENFAADGLHPSPLGHLCAARCFAELLRDELGITIDLEGGQA